MTTKKSYGSCRGNYSRRDPEREYVDIPLSEAARLCIALQTLVGETLAEDRRPGERGVRLWLNSPDGEGVTITVYREGD